MVLNREIYKRYRLMYYHFKLTLPEDMLTKVDRMSMAHSLEARLPFLDYRLVEFMANVHKDQKDERLSEEERIAGHHRAGSSSLGASGFDRKVS